MCAAKHGRGATQTRKAAATAPQAPRTLPQARSSPRVHMARTRPCTTVNRCALLATTKLCRRSRASKELQVVHALQTQQHPQLLTCASLLPECSLPGSPCARALISYATLCLMGGSTRGGKVLAGACTGIQQATHLRISLHTTAVKTGCNHRLSADIHLWLACAWPYSCPCPHPCAPPCAPPQTHPSTTSPNMV